VSNSNGPVSASNEIVFITPNLTAYEFRQYAPYLIELNGRKVPR